ncbi:hypothetical protein Q8F55_007443 [Vanrija albida]|uniref:Uncharacterized protein n=1 Tax=Vanrija albida TaxID=181172 RepID=A0ABR3PTQ4_9TREE
MFNDLSRGTELSVSQMVAIGCGLPEFKEASNATYTGIKYPVPGHLVCDRCNERARDSSLKYNGCWAMALKVAEAGGYFNMRICHSCVSGSTKCSLSSVANNVYVAFVDRDTAVWVDKKTKEVLKVLSTSTSKVQSSLSASGDVSVQPPSLAATVAAESSTSATKPTSASHIPVPTSDAIVPQPATRRPRYSAAAALDTERQDHAKQKAEWEAERQDHVEQKAAWEVERQHYANDEAAWDAERDMYANEAAAREEERRRHAEEKAAWDVERQQYAHDKVAWDAKDQQHAHDKATWNAEKVQYAANESLWNRERQLHTDAQVVFAAQRQVLADKEALHAAKEEGWEAEKRKLAAEWQTAVQNERRNMDMWLAERTALKYRIAQLEAAAVKDTMADKDTTAGNDTTAGKAAERVALLEANAVKDKAAMMNRLEDAERAVADGGDRLREAGVQGQRAWYSGDKFPAPDHLICPQCRLRIELGTDDKFGLTCWMSALTVAEKGGYFNAKICYPCCAKSVKCAASTRGSNVYLALVDKDTAVWVDKKTKKDLKTATSSNTTSNKAIDNDATESDAPSGLRIRLRLKLEDGDPTASESSPEGSPSAAVDDSEADVPSWAPAFVSAVPNLPDLRTGEGSRRHTMSHPAAAGNDEQHAGRDGLVAAIGRWYDEREAAHDAERAEWGAERECLAEEVAAARDHHAREKVEWQQTTAEWQQKTAEWQEKKAEWLAERSALEERIAHLEDNAVKLEASATAAVGDKEALLDRLEAIERALAGIRAAAGESSRRPLLHSTRGYMFSDLAPGTELDAAQMAAIGCGPPEHKSTGIKFLAPVHLMCRRCRERMPSSQQRGCWLAAPKLAERGGFFQMRQCHHCTAFPKCSASTRVSNVYVAFVDADTAVWVHKKSKKVLRVASSSTSTADNGQSSEHDEQPSPDSTVVAAASPSPPHHAGFDASEYRHHLPRSTSPRKEPEAPLPGPVNLPPATPVDPQLAAERARFHAAIAGWSRDREAHAEAKAAWDVERQHHAEQAAEWSHETQRHAEAEAAWRAERAQHAVEEAAWAHGLRVQAEAVAAQRALHAAKEATWLAERGKFEAVWDEEKRKFDAVLQAQQRDFAIKWHAAVEKEQGNRAIFHAHAEALKDRIARLEESAKEDKAALAERREIEARVAAGIRAAMGSSEV